MGKTLTPELIQMKCKTDKLSNIKNLNLWGNDLEDISLIKDMANLEICSLSLNKICSLKDFATCKKLSELYLRKNLISELLEAKFLSQCPMLKVLWLQDNPIAEHPLYRQYIVKLLPNLIKLDSNAVTPEERQQVAQISISDQDIINNNPVQSQKQQRHVDDSAYHQKQERPRSVNPQLKSKADFINPSSQIQQQNVQQQNQSQIQTPANHRNENILCAVLALLKELDENGLELVKRDVEKKIQLKNIVLEYVAKLLAPDSIIAQARQIKMDNVEKLESAQKATQLKPGDLILIRTPSSIYEAFRRLGESYYDHIAVVLDDSFSLHISYPRTKVVPTILFTHKKKQPLIIRPNFQTDLERDEFLKVLQHSSMGKQYDYYRIIQILISQSLYEGKKYDDNSTDKIVCSHQIYQALCQTMKALRDKVNRSSDYEIHKLGTFTLSDFVRLSQKNPKEFDMFSLYSFDELKENSDTNLNFEGVEISIGEDKQISKIESVMQLVGITKLKDLIDQYQVLQNISSKTLFLAQKMVMMRKQIIVAITLYKMIEIILSSYREYKQIGNSIKKNKTNFKKVLEITSLLLQILTTIQDSKEIVSTKVLKPLTKVMLITYADGKSDLKLKTLKIFNFILSIQQKVKSTFKL